MKAGKIIKPEFSNEIIERLLRRSHRHVDHALKLIRRPEAALGVVNSRLGELLVALGADGLVLVHYLPHANELDSVIARLRSLMDPVEDPRSVKEVGAEVDRYLAGEVNALRQRVDLSLVTTAFQKRVLRELQEIPRGAVVSYQTLSALAGAPNGARAVGNALHNNPVPIYVPCHRVIAADGRLGGYGGGEARKRQLLRSEGFALDSSDAELTDRTVWGRRDTRTYCRKGCPSMTRADRKRMVLYADPGYADRAGMRPCKICRPEAET